MSGRQYKIRKNSVLDRVARQVVREVVSIIVVCNVAFIALVLPFVWFGQINIVRFLTIITICYVVLSSILALYLSHWYVFFISREKAEATQQLTDASWTALGLEGSDRPKTAAERSIEWLEKAAMEDGPDASWARKTLHERDLHDRQRAKGATP